MSVICITSAQPPQLMPDAVFQAAAGLEDEGDLAAAALIYKEYSADDVRAANNLGHIWYKLGDWRRAATSFRKAIKLDPDYCLAWFNLGNALDELSRSGEAIEAYEKALKLCPDYADCLFNLAMVLSRSGHRRRSIKYWAAYAKLDTSGIWADTARAKIKQILSQDFLAVV